MMSDVVSAVASVPSDPILDIIAKVKGEPVTTIPQDLYIPPNALEVILEEVFEGPLDLLLYLIKKNNLDILNIPVAEITKQYVAYVELMQVVQLELAADYLEMAAFLAEIKSRMLLPKPASAEEEEDPRAELVRRLQEYERFKKAAENIEEIPRLGRDWFEAKAECPDFEKIKIHPEVDFKELLLALKDVLVRIEHRAEHKVQREPLSVRDRMSIIIGSLETDQFKPFVSFFNVEEGRLGVVVTFLAILELLRESLIECVQNEMYGPIYLRIPQ